MAMDMVKKYLDDERTSTDYFSETDDLLWTSSMCPKTMFFRTAVLLLKMRVYDVIFTIFLIIVKVFFYNFFMTVGRNGSGTRSSAVLWLNTLPAFGCMSISGTV